VSEKRGFGFVKIKCTDIKDRKESRQEKSTAQHRFDIYLYKSVQQK
jgi:hypothetical protein